MPAIESDDEFADEPQYCQGISKGTVVDVPNPGPSLEDLLKQHQANSTPTPSPTVARPVISSDAAAPTSSSGAHERVVDMSQTRKRTVRGAASGRGKKQKK
ncbi:hypothetical protein RhiJN_08742 [Ceratobasidium sp. AG-Ba]|nr:hypothetical protein RhiJN_08742 [Ceratobasidium sp. AG-Ba]QRW09525.1 hypothetical protein RhiLY_08524 [Ceratobasidium sp. AG-Ba]QRW09589.1 hypothetical protein RhiLY_08588 [Ceratobasidium sp. AG-Ba]